MLDASVSCDAILEPARKSHPIIYRREGLRLIRILVVDDNPAVRRYLRAILEQQESWSVCGEVGTGGEALQRVLESRPDLVVLDYQMPDLNGVDVAKQIFTMFPKIPILMVTLHLSRQLADAAREAGVRGACAKQDIGAVVEAVNLLLRDHTYFPVVPISE
jgi:DNA-binding NarL/FixJ family response regulator